MIEYSITEGNTGILYIQKMDNHENTIYRPNCDNKDARKWLYDFYELPTKNGALVKNAFIIDGVDWFPSAISELYWQFFYQFVKYKNLIEEIKTQEIEIIPIGEGRFIGFLRNIGLLRSGRFHSKFFNKLIRKIIKKKKESKLSLEKKTFIHNGYLESKIICLLEKNVYFSLLSFSHCFLSK
jgi:hypothetical protein